jgi:hypothetical protein
VAARIGRRRGYDRPVAAEPAPGSALPPQVERRLGAGRPRLHRTVIAIIVVAAVVGFFATVAVWAKRQLLETNTWTQTSTELLANDAVETAVAGFLVDALYNHVNVEGELKKALPPRIAPLAGPAAGGLRAVADKVAVDALQRPAVQQLWGDANAAAHSLFLKLIEGGGEALSTTGGKVTLNLGTIVTRLGSRVGVDVAGKIPPKAARITLLRSDQLSLVQTLVKVLKALSIVLPLLALALFGLAIYLARGWRRVALRSVGVAFLAVGILVLVARTIAGDAVTNSLASTESVKPAVDAVWSIGTSLLRDEGTALIGYGLAIIFGAWLAGTTGIARSVRREITPILRERAYGYAVAAVIVLLTWLWSPTWGTRTLVPALILIALLVAGYEALRRESIDEFPEATMAAASERWRARMARAGDWIRGRSARFGSRGAAAADRPAEDARLARLERLARLRETGVLDDDEVRAEKARILAS